MNAGKSKVKVRTDLVSSEGSLSALQMAAFFPTPHMAQGVGALYCPFLCVLSRFSRVQLCVTL